MAATPAPPPEAPITPAATDPGPVTPVKPGSPMDEMFKRIEDKYGVESTTTPPRTRVVTPKAEPAPSATPEPPKETKPEEPKKEETKEAPEPDDPELTEELGEAIKPEPATEETVEPEEPEIASEKGSEKPWKLVREHKKARAKLEAEIVELKKLIPNEVARKEELTKLENLEKQNKELLDHIRFVDFTKHPDFTEKYVKPYNTAWETTMRRLSGVIVTEADGSKRSVQPSDIAALGQLPADQAIEVAEQKFGKLGPWVAERVEELRQLNDAKFAALEKAQKEGVEFFEKSAKEQADQQKEMNGFLSEAWEKSLNGIKTHSKYGRYFNPKEGDTEFNAALETGIKKAEAALSADPRQPGLTPEQRAKIVRGHAAVRQKAAAWNVMNLTISRLESKLAAAEKKLAQYESSEPPIGGSEPSSVTPNTGNAWDSFGQRLEKYAH